MGAADQVLLVDHHCHGVMPGDIDGTEFRLLATEADVLSDPGMETLDSQFGLAIRALCAPELGLTAHVGIDEYLHRRAELGSAAVTRHFIEGTGSQALLIDTGFTASPVLTPERMAEISGLATHEIVRLERIAEETAARVSADAFTSAFAGELEAASRTALGFKSVIAYRWGFDIDDRPPSTASVKIAVNEWYQQIERTRSLRLSHPIVLQHLLWEAIRFAKPIQMHTGYGDQDIQLFRADPSRATRFFAATQETGAKFTLLHCYPFIREAAILSQVFPHVYCDVGVTGHYLGPSAITPHRQVLEIAPFNKILYSSDAYGLPEHYFVSARTWRQSLNTIMNEWISGGWTDASGADHIVGLIASENAKRIYGLEGLA